VLGLLSPNMLLIACRHYTLCSIRSLGLMQIRMLNMLMIPNIAVVCGDHSHMR
jgi:hypothetical protein